MNQKCLTTIFVPVQPLNYNINPPSVCQKHQKPLSYYNKYKPNDDPICLDCLLNEIKESKEPNLYLPISNLEQEYYSKKNSFGQIIEQTNNTKKYDVRIINFQHLLTNYFSQFIGKFINERIFHNIPQKKVELYAKSTTCVNTKEMLALLCKVENEKFVLDNKPADVFCQISILQKIFLKSHEKLEKAFKDLLQTFFVDSKIVSFTEKENSSNKSSPNEKNKTNSNPSVSSSSSKKSPDIFSSAKYIIKTSNEENISKFSPIDEPKENFIDKNKEISNASPDINMNMEKEKLLDENIEFNIEEEVKKNPFHNDLNNSFSEKANCETYEKNREKENKFDIKAENDLEIKQSEEEELPWRRKKSDEDDAIYREHKDKINKLIEKDKNKKAGNTSTNQSFYQRKKNNYKKNHNNSNLNKSYQKYIPNKFTFSKKIEYKQYNQFSQKLCCKCGSSFITTKDEDCCHNCKYISDDERLKKRGNKDYKNKKSKFYFQNSFVMQKKYHLQPHGMKKYLGNKNETQYNSNYINKTLIHSNSTFSKHFIKKMSSPKGFEERKKYSMNAKYRINKGKEKYDDKFGKNNFGGKKYYEKKKRDNKNNNNSYNNKDDFEVDLDSDEDKDFNNQSGNNTDNNKGEMSFTKTTFEALDEKIFKNICEKSDDENENKDNFDENKNGYYDNGEISEKMENNENSDNDNGDNDGDSDGDDNGNGEENDFEADF